MGAKVWKIAVVVAVQLLVLCAIPMRSLRARASNQEITLWTAPVDPFDVLGGYFVALAYEVERGSVPAGIGDQPKERDVWVTVHRGNPAWELLSITEVCPEPQPDHVSLAARWTGHRIAIVNAGRLYIPETDRDRANNAMLRDHGRGLVDMKVGAHGEVALLRLRVGGETFGESR